MPLVVKKNQDGRLMARVEAGPELYLIGKSRRMANRKSFEVRHFIIPSDAMVVYAFKGLSMSMLHTGESAGTVFGNAGGRGGGPRNVYYEGRCYMMVRNLRSPSFSLVNEQGLVFAGSNTFDYGGLCLGTAADPMNWSPVDALCFNDANRDLTWRGEYLTGIWEHNPDPEHPRARANNQIFKITSWPTWTPRTAISPVPRQILDALQDW